MPSLHFTIGLPRSGKSTFCRNWITEAPCRAIISGDDFRLAVHGQHFLPTAEGIVFAHMDVATRALLLSGFDVIVDETATTEETLLRYLRIDIDAKPIWIPTPLSVCENRAVATGREFLLGPMRRHAKQMSALSADWPQNFERLRKRILSRQPDDQPALSNRGHHA